jgi:cytochrome P450
MTMTTPGGPSLASPDFWDEMRADPYPFYHRLRSFDPVHWHEPYQAWLVSRYDDVSAVLRDPQMSSERGARLQARSGREDLAPFFTMRSSAMLNADPPRHNRLRGLVSKAFTPRAVEAMRPAIQEMVDGFLDTAQAQSSFDVMRDLAYPLPVTVIAQMLGVPCEDRARFKGWSDDVAMLAGNEFLELGADVFERAYRSYMELADYFRGRVENIRAHPGANLLSAMAAAEELGDKLNATELYANAILLLNAGHETTTNLIGNGTLALLQSPDQLQKLREDESLIENAVEELLRYDSPVQLTSRIAREDLELGGRSIKQGQLLLLLLGAANRDPAQFPDPDRLDITRPDIRHASFGFGPHYCLGAPLARLEGQIALLALIRRFPNLRLEGGPPRYRQNFNLRGLEALLVAAA